MKNTSAALIGLGIIGACALYAASAKPTPVEVWTGGDDSLSQDLRFEVENRFESASNTITNGITISEVNRPVAFDRYNGDLLHKAVVTPALPGHWRDLIFERIHRLATSV